VQAHTLGEVGNLGTVLFVVCSGTFLSIFFEIGLYLRDREQHISWHSFFETRCRMRTRWLPGLGGSWVAHPRCYSRWFNVAPDIYFYRAMLAQSAVMRQ